MNILAENLFARLKDQLGEQVFQTWIAPMRINSWSDGVLILTVPTRFYQEWIGGRYRGFISEAAAASAGTPVRVVLEVEPESEKPASAPGPGPSRPAPTAAPLPLQPDLNPFRSRELQSLCPRRHRGGGGGARQSL
jgi:chromosomal replication initiator protein